MSLPAGATRSSTTLGEILTLRTTNGTAVVALHGATVISFIPSGGREVVFTSPTATIAGNKPIRGGIPLCGPWFGPHPHVATAPVHGLLRQRLWRLDRVESDGEHLVATLVLDLPAEPALGWVHQARATATVTVGATLAVELTMRNTGSTPFLLSGALHSYWAVSDVRQARVEGLQDRAWIDFTPGGGALRRETAATVSLTGEAARFYRSCDPVRLVDPGWNRALALRSWGAADTVVWNPWERSAAAMADMGAAWSGFLCVEQANIPASGVMLPPAHSHHLGVEVAVETLAG
jgi:glucose-6-phosphate 1-epimerase